MTGPQLLMAMQTDVSGETEAEPVTVEDDGQGVRFVLVDGSSLVFDRGELAEALGWSDGHTGRSAA